MAVRTLRWCTHFAGTNRHADAHGICAHGLADDGDERSFDAIADAICEKAKRARIPAGWTL